MPRRVIGVNFLRVCSEREGEAPAEPSFRQIVKSANRQVGKGLGSPGGSPSHRAQFPNTLTSCECAALVVANSHSNIDEQPDASFAFC
ncbi:MAG: hypothetical protein ACO2PL_05475 [Armatimonadota bacterium]